MMSAPFIGAPTWPSSDSTFVKADSFELMLNAANLAFVTFSRINGNLDGQVVAFFTMVVAACEVVVGLAIIVTIFRSRRSASIDDASLLNR